MEMEVMIPIHNMDFDFNSARSSPRHISAPSTPRRFGEYYFSAPPSPSRISQFYRDFEEFLAINEGENGFQTEGDSIATVPFDWEEKPGTPKSPRGGSNHDDFAFDVSEDFETPSVSAEELFDGGVIKPLKPPPRLQLPDAEKIDGSAQNSPPAAISPRSRGRKAIMGAFSPRNRKESGPFGTAAQRSTRRTPERERGRARAPGMSSSSRRATRSLSPLRVSDEECPWDEEDQQQPNKEQSSSMSPKPFSSPTTAALSSSSSSKNFKKWSFKDFFLFRSASEGRACDKDPFRKYTAFRRYDEVKISSTKAIESTGSGSMSRRRGPVSAHELHYTINRAVSEDLKKKTFLPYKQGILGRLAFNPAVHALANGFGFSRN